LITAPLPSHEELNSFFLIVDDCGSSSSLSGPTFIAEALTSAAVSSFVRRAN
jgi:hypothetical protein